MPTINIKVEIHHADYCNGCPLLLFTDECVKYGLDAEINQQLKPLVHFRGRVARIRPEICRAENKEIAK